MGALLTRFRSPQSTSNSSHQRCDSMTVTDVFIEVELETDDDNVGTSYVYCTPVSETTADRICASMIRYNNYVYYDKQDLSELLRDTILFPADDISGDGKEGYGDPELYNISDTTREVFGLASGDKTLVLTN